MTSLQFQNAPNYQSIYTTKKQKNFLDILNNPKFFGILILLVLLLIYIFSEKITTPDQSAFQKRQQELRHMYEHPKAIVDLNNTYKKQQAAWQEDWSMPSWEDLFSLSTTQLIRLYERMEATGNRLLVDMIREVLLARSLSEYRIDFKKFLPPAVYTVVVVRTEVGFGVSILESDELFRQVAHSDWYAGATDVYIRGDGFFEMQESTRINSRISGIDREIIEGIVKSFLEEIGLKNADGSPTWKKGTIFPELPWFSAN